LWRLATTFSRRAMSVHQDNDPTKDMTYADIVAAIANLERTGVGIAGGFWVLYVFRWS
jgi:hypothetical protein